MPIKSTKKVILPFALEMEEGEPVKEVLLTEPFAGEMRGLKFANILETDMDTMVTLIPRISKLTERQMINMKPANITPLIEGALSFFVEDDSQSDTLSA
jgi:hypothetical protein